MVLIVRHWHDCAGNARVLGFARMRSKKRFFTPCWGLKKCWHSAGKHWFSISKEELHLRFLGRVQDPLKHYKFGPMDLESRRRWGDHTQVKKVMLERIHIVLTEIY